MQIQRLLGKEGSRVLPGTRKFKLYQSGIESCERTKGRIAETGGGLGLRTPLHLSK